MTNQKFPQEKKATKMEEGIYEQLVTELVSEKIDLLKTDCFYINKNQIEKTEASGIISKHLSNVIKQALNQIKSDNKIEVQIKIANKIIQLLQEELTNEDFSGDIISINGEILTAVFSKVDQFYSDINLHLKEMIPQTTLSRSQLFTGSNTGFSLDSELKKEILSSNRIDLLVSFIKFSGFIILQPALKEFTSRGGKLRVITTTYMGASDYKAIKQLSEMPNTEVKISYNTGNERLHAKAYYFHRNSGFHTAYIGSSNFSRSALTNGLEWNLKVSTKEASLIIDTFRKTFDSYWNNRDFELFDNTRDEIKLKKSLKNISTSNSFNTSFLDVKPYPFQKEILEKLQVERVTHQSWKNLIVAATGTGKTVISAFDYKNFKKKNSSAKLLFLAHRKEILTQAQHTYQSILKDNNFGELRVDGIEPIQNEYVFSSIQSLKNKLENSTLTSEYYDYIVIDECHHLTAKSYRGILKYFKPKVLLGLTATPERMDGGDIQEDFNNKIAAEIRLPEALNNKLLCPFQYFGVTDSVDLSQVNWRRGDYLKSELSSIYLRNKTRVSEIIHAIEKYTNDIHENRALGFCITIEHAKYMAEQFQLAGLKADYLTSENNNQRDAIRDKLKRKEINYLFVVDIFNEGVDIPEIDTVLFLRPTQSLTIFLQQLGRGLRLADDKDCLCVLDFVANARPEYNFENKFRALIGKTSTTIASEIEKEFPRLPLGCAIVLERKAKDIILNNIKAATTLNKKSLINKISTFEHSTNLDLTLSNFIKLTNIPLQLIYKRGSWSRLCQLAGKRPEFSNNNEKEIVSAISKKWLSSSSMSYFNFILNLAKSDFKFNIKEFSNSEKKMLLMLHYDIWQESGKHQTIEKSIESIGMNKVMVKEIVAIMEVLISQISYKEINDLKTKEHPLKIHSRYTRDQILAAMGFSTFTQKSSNREGVAFNKTQNTELLFINLLKSEENFSPSTMYNDYAINEKLFHWQSQNSAGPNTKKGLSYINHKITNKRILLFVREKAKDEHGNTMGYVFLGDADIKDYYGTKPMNIKWKLEEPLPHYLWTEAAKLRVG